MRGATELIGLGAGNALQGLRTILRRGDSGGKGRARRFRGDLGAPDVAETVRSL